MSLKAVSMQNLTIINHNGNHYHVNFAFISKKDAYNLIKNAIFIGLFSLLLLVIICFCVFAYFKWLKSKYTNNTIYTYEQR